MTQATLASGDRTDQRHTMRVEDLCRLSFVSDPEVEPSGSRVAFVVTRARADQTGYHSEIRLAILRGERVYERVLTRPDQFARYGLPRWSPDGSRLAFLSNRGQGMQVWELPMKGGEARQLTNLASGASYFAWSPDGRYLACTGRLQRTEGNPGHDPHLVAPTVQVYDSIKYKADGRGLDDGRRTHIWVVDVQSGAARCVTQGHWDHLWPAWSPDGRRLAYVSNRTPDPDASVFGDLYVLDLISGEEQKLTRSRGPVGAPAWSPDGQLLAYLGHEHPAGPGYRNNFEVWKVPADGSSMPISLTADFDRSTVDCCITDMRDPSAYAPAAVLWSAGDYRLYFLASDNGNTHLFSASSRGGDVRREIGGERQIFCFAVDPAARTIVYGSSDWQEPGELYWAEAGHGVPAIAGEPQPEERPAGEPGRRVSAANDHVMAGMVTSHPERVAIRVGEPWGTVDGWILRPPGFDPQRKYPAIVQVHRATFGTGFYHEFQTMAARGYVVFYMNQIGALGYGQAFAVAQINAYGGDDIAQIHAGVDYLASLDYVDEHAIGVTGGSSGGYLTNWLVTHTNRFQAAVTQRSMTDLLSFFGTSDIGYDFGDWEIGGSPWQNWGTYRYVSPVTYAKDVQTPLLIVHSDQDYRTPVSQAEQFYVSLKQLGKTVEFVRFQGENHNLARSGKPVNRRERLQRIIGWFDRYLQ